MLRVDERAAEVSPASAQSTRRSTMTGGERKVCIVGASGKLGQYMVQHALDRGYAVVGVCREESVGKLDAFKGRITVVPGATNDAEVIERAVAGCDAVLVVLVPRGVHGYASGTAQAVLDHAPPARASSSRADGTSRATARTCTRGSSRRS
jgi:uncharacterized protein YbjT (DUF2867 family)